MKYVSTRSAQRDLFPFSDILLEGLAADGGLYMPQEYPQLDDSALTIMREIFDEGGYPALAAYVLGLFVDDIPADDIAQIVLRAYTPEKFVPGSAEPALTPGGQPIVTPATPIGETGLWLGHLSNGPTAAFKDMAMQLLGELFEYELQRRGETLTILGATSGDTGSAAEYALRGRSGISVFMLTPSGRMTPFQRAQMFSLHDPNIVNVAIDGVFDDCQEIVKAVNADKSFKAKYCIGAVNSINWARLLAQIVYYIALWIQVAPTNSHRISFAVPSGNFGNICAGHIARQMGVPIDRLILATNENNVLDEFFRTGVYRVRAASDVAKTSSPSMDIAKASNFERFIYDLLGGDAEAVASLFGHKLRECGEFSLEGTSEFAQIPEKYGFISGSSRHEDRLETIARLYSDYQILIDPHTADGVHVATQLRGEIETPIIVLETALPVKFAQTISEAIGRAPLVPPRFEGIENGVPRVVDLPNSVDAVMALIAQYSR